MKVVTETQEWPRRLRRAGINSFGYGGANAHVILESLGSYLNEPRRQSIQPLGMEFSGMQLIVPISAASPTSLEKRKLQVMEEVSRCSSSRLRDLIFTLSMRRSHLRMRDFLIATTNENEHSSCAEMATTE